MPGISQQTLIPHGRFSWHRAFRSHFRHSDTPPTTLQHTFNITTNPLHVFNNKWSGGVVGYHVSLTWFIHANTEGLRFEPGPDHIFSVESVFSASYQVYEVKEDILFFFFPFCSFHVWKPCLHQVDLVWIHCLVCIDWHTESSLATMRVWWVGRPFQVLCTPDQTGIRG